MRGRIAASRSNKGWFRGWGRPCHLCCRGRFAYTSDAPSEVLNSRLLLRYAPFNKVTLFGSQIR